MAVDELVDDGLHILVVAFGLAVCVGVIGRDGEVVDPKASAYCFKEVGDTFWAVLG